MAKSTPVGLEVGAKKAFAWALDWPGWCRAGRTEELALAALADYAERYAEVAAQAAIPFSTALGTTFEVIDRVPGNATTDFGAPGLVTPADHAPLTPEEAARLAALVDAGWDVFDRIAAHSPESLRKGPRGGGRDRTKMIDHVLSAEAAYARKLAIKHTPPAPDDPAAIKSLRHAVLAALATPTPPDGKGWPPRYAARRIAWHVLDHAWEMQDRTDS